ncbi:MAG: hypothetical protein ACREUS_13825 [Burkholderiales bacterium]
MKEEQLREDQRREALARKEEPAGEETLPPPAPQVEAPRIDSKALLESDGLVMIETDRSKAPPQAQAAEEPQHLGRPRRERPKAAAQDDELVQVETTRK